MYPPAPRRRPYPTSTNRQAHEVSGLFWRKIIVDSAWTAIIRSTSVRRCVDLWGLAVDEPAEDTVGGIDFWGLAQYYDNGD